MFGIGLQYDRTNLRCLCDWQVTDLTLCFRAWRTETGCKRWCPSENLTKKDNWKWEFIWRSDKRQFTWIFVAPPFAKQRRPRSHRWSFLGTLPNQQASHDAAFVAFHLVQWWPSLMKALVALRWRLELKSWWFSVFCLAIGMVCSL